MLTKEGGGGGGGRAPQVVGVVFVLLHAIHVAVMAARAARRTVVRAFPQPPLSSTPTPTAAHTGMHIHSAVSQRGHTRRKPGFVRPVIDDGVGAWLGGCWGQPASAARALTDAADALRDACEAVRTQAQAGSRDLADELERTPAAWAEVATDTLVRPAAIPADWSQVRYARAPYAHAHTQRERERDVCALAYARVLTLTARGYPYTHAHTHTHTL
jgi:hypothetical protein